MSVLHILRRSSRSVAGLLIIVFCVILMASWNIDNSLRHSQRSNEVALSLGDKDISMYEYELMRERVAASWRSRVGKQFDSMRSLLEPQIASQTLDALVLRLVMDSKSAEFGLTAAPTQIRNKIISDAPFYGRDFDPDVYGEFVRENNMTKAEYENLVRLDLIRDQLHTMFQDLTTLPDEELKAIEAGDKTKFKFRYTLIPASRFTSEVQKTDEQLQKFLDEHQDEFRKPKTVRFSWLEFKPEDLLSHVEVSEEDLRSLYQSKAVTFIEPKQFHVRKISFPKVVTTETTATPAPSASPEKTKADAALARLKAGEDFKKLAAELNEDATLKAQSGDVGWTVLSLLEAGARDGVSNLDLGEYTGVIDEATGASIYYLEEVKPERQKPFEEVRAQLEDELRRDGAPVYAQAEAENFLQALRNGDGKDKSLKDFAATKNLAVQTTDPIPSTMSPTGAGPDLTREVMELSQGDKEEVTANGKIYVVEVLEMKDSYIPPLTEVRDAVATRFEAVESQRLARLFAEKLVGIDPSTSTEAPKKSLSEIASANNLEIKETDSVNRLTPSGEIFQASGVSDIAFSLTLENPLAKKVFEMGDKVALLELAAVEPADLSTFDKDKEKLRQQQAERSADRLLGSLIEVLKKDADVKPNPSLGKTQQSL